MNKQSKIHKSGQILVILLLVLSILSIFILSMVMNTKKDTQERIDNKKYEQFYALAENKIINVQNLIGVSNDYDELIESKYDGECNTTSIDTYDAIHCSFAPESYEYGNYNDLAKTDLYIIDSSSIQLFELSSDSNLNIDIISNNKLYSDDINIYWNSIDSVDWVITIDYYEQSTDINIPSYKSFKLSTINTNKPINNLLKIIGGTTVNEVNYASGIKFNVASIISNLGISDITNLVGLRVKPLIGKSGSKVSMAIVPSNLDSFPSQFRRVIAVVNSDTESNSNSSSPTIILNTEYPLTTAVSPLFDYVLRTGEIVQINNP